MIAQHEILVPQKIGFDSQKYAEEQKKAILERIQKFSGGKLYLEIGGKFLFDAHAARVLPGFDPETKKRIFTDLAESAEILFCVDSRDIVHNRQLSNKNESYTNAALKMIEGVASEVKKPKIVINLCHRRRNPVVLRFSEHLRELGFEVFFRFLIGGYPHDLSKILSSEGYGKDDFIETEKNLILVTGAASNSGKMSTCLGQIYLDHHRGIESGYAKYETFPIWNLPLDHPVNLAYEAATADIGDFNQMDPFHPTPSVNYNRDVEAFEIVMRIARAVVGEKNEMRNYRSPTDMGINRAGFSITNDAACCEASIAEIERRKQWYAEIINRGEGKKKWVEKCNLLLRKAKKYL